MFRFVDGVRDLRHFNTRTYKQTHTPKVLLCADDVADIEKLFWKVGKLFKTFVYDNLDPETIKTTSLPGTRPC